jgi:hypothetical protein
LELYGDLKNKSITYKALLYSHSFLVVLMIILPFINGKQLWQDPSANFIGGLAMINWILFLNQARKEKVISKKVFYQIVSIAIIGLILYWCFLFT